MKPSALFFLLFVVAVQAAAQTSPHALDGEWTIDFVNQTPASGDKTPYIGILTSDQRLYGCAGCNRIVGTVLTSDNQPNAVSFPSVGSTRMLCPNRGTESAVLQALRAVAAYKISDGSLTLTDSAGTILLTLTRRPDNLITSLDGTWIITQVYGEDIPFIENPIQTPVLTFNSSDMSFGGSTGCNAVEGEISGSADKMHAISFTNVLTTTALCDNSKLEAQILNALNSVSGFTLASTSSLTLTDADGAPALTLSKKE